MTAPSAQLAAVAEVVRSDLAAAAFVRAAGAIVARGFAQRHPLEDTGKLLMVFPRKSRTTRFARGGLLTVDLDVSVAVFSRLTGSDTEIDQQIDDLLYLSQQVADYFHAHALTGRTEALVEATTDATGDIDFDPARLMEAREFEAVLSLTFRGTRQP